MDKSHPYKEPEAHPPVLSPEQRSVIWCAVASLTVYADRRNNNEVGQPLSEFHKGMLSDRCGEIDFDKWVTENEANKDANHRAMEILKKKVHSPE